MTDSGAMVAVNELSGGAAAMARRYGLFGRDEGEREVRQR